MKKWTKLTRKPTTLILARLAPTVEAVMDTLGVNTIEAVADWSYFKIDDIDACEKPGITDYVPKPIRGRAVAEGFFSREQLRYDPDKDIHLCPADQVLSPRHYGKSGDNVKIDYVNRDACKACCLRERCTRSFRRVSHLENEGALDRMAECRADRPDILDRRRESVKDPFGTIKQCMYQGVPDAAPGKRSRGVKPDGAGLKYRKGPSPCRRCGSYRRCQGMTAPLCASSEPQYGCQTVPSYGKRALVETVRGRYKAIIGLRMHARSFSAQQTDAAIGVAILTQMLSCGRPQSVRWQALTGATQ